MEIVLRHNFEKTAVEKDAKTERNQKSNAKPAALFLSFSLHISEESIGRFYKKKSINSQARLLELKKKLENLD